MQEESGILNDWFIDILHHICQLIGVHQFFRLLLVTKADL